MCLCMCMCVCVCVHVRVGVRANVFKSQFGIEWYDSCFKNRHKAVKSQNGYSIIAKTPKWYIIMILAKKQTICFFGNSYTYLKGNGAYKSTK